MNKLPLQNSRALAAWAASVITAAGKIFEVAQWRMLEYWMQVELYRAVQSGYAGKWKHLGDHEQPYFTMLPRTGSKYNTKWVDLVFAEPSLKQPRQIVWIELKDIGRSQHRLQANASGLGQDLSRTSQSRSRKDTGIMVCPIASYY